MDAAVNRRAILVRPAAILPEDYRPADASGEQCVRPVHAARVVQSPLISGLVRQDDSVLRVEQRCRRLALPASAARLPLVASRSDVVRGPQMGHMSRRRTVRHGHSWTLALAAPRQSDKEEVT